jgi:hypothetical protein
VCMLSQNLLATHGYRIRFVSAVVLMEAFVTLTVNQVHSHASHMYQCLWNVWAGAVQVTQMPT